MNYKVEKNRKINLIISKEVEQKIKFLCENISTVEWSGILLFKPSTNCIADKDFSIKAMDIIPMDIGNKTFTNFEYNEVCRDTGEHIDRHIDYCESKGDEAFEYSLGLIHSHNTMDVFFSCTDMDELLNNSKSHNYYLSVIVNNAGHIIASISTYYKASNILVSCISSDDEGNPRETYVYSPPLDLCILHECEIIFESDINNDNNLIIESDELFMTSYNALKEKYDGRNNRQI